MCTQYAAQGFVTVRLFAVNWQWHCNQLLPEIFFTTICILANYKRCENFFAFFVRFGVPKAYYIMRGHNMHLSILAYQYGSRKKTADECGQGCGMVAADGEALFRHTSGVRTLLSQGKKYDKNRLTYWINKYFCKN